MNGLAPRDLSLAKLMEIRTEDWDEQERQLGLNIDRDKMRLKVRPDVSFSRRLLCCCFA